MDFELKAGTSMLSTVVLAPHLPVEFAVDETRVILRTPTPEEMAEDPSIGIGLAVLARRTAQPPDTIIDIFRSLAQGRLPPTSLILQDRPSNIDAGGNFSAMPQRKFLPEVFRVFADNLEQKLWSEMSHVVATFQWRLRWPGPRSPFVWWRFCWSLDGLAWWPMPFRELFIVKGGDWFDHHPMSNEHMVAALQHIQDTLGRPVKLGHELFRDACNARHGSPRSCLLLAIAAAEVAFKEHVAVMAPDAAWLVENVPSPPIVIMLSRYLPRLPARNSFSGRVLPPPKDIRKTLGGAVELRNKLAHVGPIALLVGQLDNILLAVEDVLWLLDYYQGFEWALDYVRPTTRRQLLSTQE